MSKRSSYTDYYKMSWDVVIKPTSTTKPKILRTITIVTAVILTGILAYFLNSQLGFGSYEFFWIVFIFGAAIIIILGIFWGRLNQLVGGTKIISYRLDYNGLTINKENHDFEEFELDKLKKQLAENSIKSVEQDYYFSLLLPKHKMGQIEIYVPDNQTLNKLLKSLKHYVDEYED